MRLTQPEIFMVVLLGVEMLQAELPVFENFNAEGTECVRDVKRVVVAWKEILRRSRGGMKLLSDCSQAQTLETALPLSGRFAGDQQEG